MNLFQKRLLPTVCAFALLLSLAACQTTQPVPATEPVTEPITEPTTEPATEPSYAYVFRANLSAYLPYLNPDGGMLLLANKQQVLGAEYVPAETVTVDASLCYGKEILLDKIAAMAITAMITEMRAEGISDVFVTSGYRSYARQQSLYNYYCTLESSAHPAWTQDEVRAFVLTYSAYPGTSEHQTGLCVDLMTTKMTDLYNYGSEYPSGYGVGFAETSAYPWLLDNAYKFGFILRYPEGKENVTGYSYESWHYRFVGQAAARAIHDGNLTLEEYLKQ